jgi:hypothetical protein
MTHGSLASNRIVDLLHYKREREQRRLDFGPDPAPTPSLAPVAPFRPLSADDVTHRERMLRHLTQSR